MLVAGCSEAQPTSESPSLREAIAQMLVVGFRGTQVDSTHHIVRDILQHHIGGVILFEYDAPSGSRPRNITSAAQLRQLCTDLQSLRAEPLLISIDQEGGRVSRLKEAYGFPHFASAQHTAEQGDDSVTACARLTAQTLHEMGVNVDFAPCVDVNVNPQCPVIGRLERSFSSQPAQVAHCAAIWLDELSRQGVIACPKHFPGHGSSQKDSHLGLADVSRTWQAGELEPYQTLIATRQVPMIMTTHVFNSRLDPTWPATLSHATLTTLLRDSLGFDGVIITDDLAMGAMTKQYSYDTILRRAIAAGANMLCLSNNGNVYDADLVPRTIDAVERLVREGQLDAELIFRSAERVWAMKARYLRPPSSALAKPTEPKREGAR